MPLPGYKRLSESAYETPTGQRISRRQYDKIRRGGITNEQLRKQRAESNQQSRHQYWVTEYIRNQGHNHPNRRAAMQDPGFKRAYHWLTQPFHKKDTMSEAKWNLYGRTRWNHQVEALRYIYGQKELTGDKISKHFSPEQE